MGVLEGEEGRGEGLERRPLGSWRRGCCEAEDRGGGGGEVDELGFDSVSGVRVGNVGRGEGWTCSLVRDDCFAVAAFDGEGLFAGEGVWRLERQGGAGWGGEEGLFSGEGDEGVGPIEHDPTGRR